MIRSISRPSSVRLIRNTVGQRGYDIAVGHQQIARGDTAVRDQGIDGTLACAEQQGGKLKLTRATHIRNSSDRCLDP